MLQKARNKNLDFEKMDEVGEKEPEPELIGAALLGIGGDIALPGITGQRQDLVPQLFFLIGQIALM